jgi:hypothetical protein
MNEESFSNDFLAVASSASDVEVEETSLDI